MSIRQNSLEIVSPPSSPSNDELRMRRRMEKLKEEANAAAERYKAVKASGAKEESKGAYCFGFEYSWLTSRQRADTSPPVFQTQLVI